jgi:hypothetical protein
MLDHIGRHEQTAAQMFAASQRLRAPGGAMQGWQGEHAHEDNGDRMTKQQFIDRAVRAAQHVIGVPLGSGWLGTYRHLRHDDGWQIRRSACAWTLRDPDDGKTNMYFSTNGAITMARQLGAK